MTKLLSAAVLVTASILGPQQSAFAEDPMPLTTAEAVEAALDAPMTVEFVETPLADALDFITSRVRIPFYLHADSLADYGCSPDDEVTLSIPAVPVKKVLDLLLRDAVGDLDWYLDSGIVHVTTAEEAEYHLITRVYDVKSLLVRSDSPYAGSYWSGESSGCGFYGGSSGGMGGAARSGTPSGSGIESQAADGGGFFQVGDGGESGGPVEAPSGSGCPVSGQPRPVDHYDFDSLMATLEMTVMEESWQSVGGAATMSPVVVGEHPLLVVSQSYRGHSAVADLLEQLGAFAVHDEAEQKEAGAEAAPQDAAEIGPFE